MKRQMLRIGLSDGALLLRIKIIYASAHLALLSFLAAVVLPPVVLPGLLPGFAPCVGGIGSQDIPPGCFGSALSFTHAAPAPPWPFPDFQKLPETSGKSALWVRCFIASKCFKMLQINF